MRCPQCKDTFAIVQIISIIKEYLNELPSKPRRNKESVPLISIQEIEDVRIEMEKKNILSSLNPDGRTEN
jgi:hypothetical protein